MAYLSVRDVALAAFLKRIEPRPTNSRLSKDRERYNRRQDIYEEEKFAIIYQFTPNNENACRLVARWERIEAKIRSPNQLELFAPRPT